MNAWPSDWRRCLQAAVSPLGDGVGPLSVKGLGPPSRPGSRPQHTAAVLVPVLEQPEPVIVLTRRSDHLPQHAGQVSFPGGRAEEGDASAVATAMREAYEEIGLPGERVTPLGFLDRFDIISDYRVLPVVATVRGPVEWQLDEFEVAEVFTVPLHVAVSRDAYQKNVYVRDGVRHTFYSMEWEGHTIWGATAAMLLNLGDRLERQWQSEIA